MNNQPEQNQHGEAGEAGNGEKFEKFYRPIKHVLRSEEDYTTAVRKTADGVDFLLISMERINKELIALKRRVDAIKAYREANGNKL